MTAAVGRAAGRVLRDPLWLVLLSLGVTALVLRVLWLDTVPGLNGDEAWYGVWALRCLHQGVCALYTPTGNPTNPFFMALVATFQSAIPSSTTALRLPAVLSGIAMVVLGYMLLRAPLGRQPAMAFAILAAALPINIGYSRFGWDAAQIGLAATLILALAVRGNWVLAIAAWGAALLVHPTIIFLVPMMMIVILGEVTRPWLERLGRAKCLAVIGVGLLATLLVSWRLHGAVTVGESHAQGWAWIGQFLVAFVELFSSSTIDEYIVGSAPSVPGDIIAAAGLGAVAVVLLREMMRRPWSREAAVLVGFLVMLIGFAGTAGPGALAPGWERYGVVLVAPVVLLGAVAIGNMFGAEGRRGLWVAAAVGWLALAGFIGGYMVPLANGDGRAADPATVAEVDPKLTAAAILRDWAQGESRIIATDSWWTFEPLVYFLWSTPTLHIARLSTPDADNADYAATLAGSDADRRLAALRQPAAVIRDLAGRPAIDLWRLKD